MPDAKLLNIGSRIHLNKRLGNNARSLWVVLGFILSSRSLGNCSACKSLQGNSFKLLQAKRDDMGQAYMHHRSPQNCLYLFYRGRIRRFGHVTKIIDMLRKSRQNLTKDCWNAL